MNILFIKHFFVGFMVSEIPRVSVFGHCPYSVTFPYTIFYSKDFFKLFHNCGPEHFNLNINFIEFCNKITQVTQSGSNLVHTWFTNKILVIYLVTLSQKYGSKLKSNLIYL